MAEKQRWPLAAALEVAQYLQDILTPYCQRPPTIAGSIRRLRPDVGDIELLCIPRLERRQASMFEAMASDGDLLDWGITKLMNEGELAFRRSEIGRTTYGPLNKLLVHVRSGIGVDIFSTTPENWGMALVVRTGPAQYCVKVMSRLRTLGHRGHAYGGISLKSGEELACPTEEMVFETLGWAWKEPEKRL